MTSTTLLTGTTLEDLEKSIVRLEFIVQNIFAYLLRNVYTFHATSAIHYAEAEVLNIWKEVLDDFSYNHAGQVQQLCHQLNVESLTNDNLDLVLVGVSNELFSDGITFPRIMGLFTFVREWMTLSLVRHQSPKVLVDEMYDCLSRLVQEKLDLWVNDHGGWRGVECFLPPPHPISKNKFCTIL